MQFTVKNENSYSKTIALLALLTSVTVLACTQLGYILMPFAAAFYAALLIYDKTPGKILSIFLPLIFFVVNLLFSGLYSLDAVAYAIVGVIIYFAVTKKITRGETAVYLTSVIVFSMILSAIFIAFKEAGRVDVSAITEFYGALYNTLKEQFVAMLMSLTTENAEGLTVFAYNVHDAEALFRELVIFAVPMLILCAFLLAGISLKFFSRTVKKISGEESGIMSWRFTISNFIAYFYIAVAIMSMLASGDSSVFSIAVVSVNTVLSCVFAYIGVTFVYGIIRSRGKSAFFSASLIILVCIILSSFALQLLSFLGVYFSIVTNRLLNGKNEF